MKFHTHIFRQVAIAPSPRVAQMMGLFDVQPALHSTQAWDVDFTLPETWNVGVIVGPSGCGKSTIARECFGDCLTSGFAWPEDKSIVDGFPADMGIRDVTGLLSSVGFSSPPAWLRPFRVLSNGQQFRANLARTLAENPALAVVDEFTSVVDRAVARIGSAAVARTIRRRNQKFIAVTCHYDVLDWLEPDWVYEPHVAKFTPSREGLWRRPEIALDIARVDSSAWQLFKPHHYLSASLHPSAACYVGLIENQPAVFTAVLPFPHPTRPGWREHRTVCLPDFQGVGIGNAMSEFVASIYQATGKPYTSTTSHPAMIRHRARSALWRMTRVPGVVGGHAGRSSMRKTGAVDRITAGFRYVGPARVNEAREFGIAVCSYPFAACGLAVSCRGDC